MKQQTSGSRGALVKYLPVGLLVIAVSLTGCDNKVKTYPVSGKVQFADGTPAMFGVVELQSTEQPINARGTIQRDGSFVLGTLTDDDGAIPGKHNVVITQLVANHFNVDIVHNHGDLVHPKYGSYRTTDLTITVQPEKKGNEVLLTVDKRVE